MAVQEFLLRICEIQVQGQSRRDCFRLWHKNGFNKIVGQVSVFDGGRLIKLNQKCQPPSCTYAFPSQTAQRAELPARCAAKSSSWPCVQIGAAVQCLILRLRLGLRLWLSSLQLSVSWHWSWQSHWHIALRLWHLQHILCAHCPASAAVGDSFAEPSLEHCLQVLGTLLASDSDCSAPSWLLVAKSFAFWAKCVYSTVEVPVVAGVPDK